MRIISKISPLVLSLLFIQFAAASTSNPVCQHLLTNDQMSLRQVMQTYVEIVRNSGLSLNQIVKARSLGNGVLNARLLSPGDFTSQQIVTVGEAFGNSFFRRELDLELPSEIDLVPHLVIRKESWKQLNELNQVVSREEYRLYIRLGNLVLDENLRVVQKPNRILYRSHIHTRDPSFANAQMYSNTMYYFKLPLKLTNAESVNQESPSVGIDISTISNGFVDRSVLGRDDISAASLSPESASIDRGSVGVGNFFSDTGPGTKSSPGGFH